VFFVPHAVVNIVDDMNILQKAYSQITITEHRKAVVVISRIDELIGDDEREKVKQKVVSAFKIEPSLVYFLENYTKSVDKDFRVDKNILRILHAMLKAADGYYGLKITNPKIMQNPFGRSTAARETDVEFAEFLRLLSPSFGKKLQNAGFASVGSFEFVDKESWKDAGFSVVEVAEIQAALVRFDRDRKKKINQNQPQSFILDTRLEKFLAQNNPLFQNNPEVVTMLREGIVDKELSYTEFVTMEKRAFKGFLESVGISKIGIIGGVFEAVKTTFAKSDSNAN